MSGCNDMASVLFTRYFRAGYEDTSQQINMLHQGIRIVEAELMRVTDPQQHVDECSRATVQTKLQAQFEIRGLQKENKSLHLE